METRGYRISGRVQGVGFRYWTLKTADRLRLSGSVRNLPDGTVEVIAHGDPASLATLEEALAKGPPGARVASVAPFHPAAAPHTGFSIQ